MRETIKSYLFKHTLVRIWTKSFLFKEWYRGGLSWTWPIKRGEFLGLCFMEIYTTFCQVNLIWVHTIQMRSPGSAVGVATGYGLDDRGIGVLVAIGSRMFTSPYRSDRLWGPPSLLSNWYRRPFSTEIKRQWREADHSSPTSAEVKNTWIYTFTPPYVFMA
jgi:hypothetical protein